MWNNPEYIKQEVPTLLKPVMAILSKRLKIWDFRGAQRVTKFIANSKEVQSRVKKYYDHDSEVIYPFVDTGFWRPSFMPVIARRSTSDDEAILSSDGKIASAALATTQKRDYFLLAGRLQAHKKNDLIVEIFNELGLPLHIAGTGRQEAYLKSIAKPNIKFLGHVSDEQLRDQYSGAKAYIYPQLEDFGLMPLEAAACGTATLALGQGGALETVVPGSTGELFGLNDVVQALGLPSSSSATKQATGLHYKDQIKQLILSWNSQKYKIDALRAQAEKFSKEKFKEKILNQVTSINNGRDLLT